ncbi:MAG: winged helix-turn-helix domain-containing protein [Bryobacteraceae bacterium]
MAARTKYRSGPFAIEPALRTLHRGGESVGVTPKVFDMLLVFLQSGNRVVTREELSAALWPGQLITGANLNQHVSMLRNVLDDASEGRHCLVTIPGRGYQWVLPVEVEEGTGEGSSGGSHTTVSAALRKWLRIAAVAAAVLGVAAFLGPRLLGPGDRPARTSMVTKHALTRLPGSEYQPALSPDGTKVAFVWRENGRPGTAVFVKGLGDEESRRVSSPADSESSDPAWSPDGRLLAYLRYRPNVLDVVVRPERGGEERTVGRLYPSRYGLDCRHLDWSPNGTTLVVDDKADPNEPFGLFLIDVASGLRTRLTHPREDIIGDVNPRFSPDGSRISFIRMNDYFGMEVLTIDLKQLKQKEWIRDRGVISDQDWSADGRRIFFGSNRGGEYRVWTLPLDGNAVSPTSVSSANPLQISVARTGSKLVYSDVQHDLNIWRLELATAGTAKENWTSIVSSTAEDIFPQISPDGSKLCFRSDRSGEGQLWVSDLDGNHVAQVTAKPAHPVAGRWSPDSRTLVFNDASDHRMYTVDAAGGVPRLVGGQGTHPIFSNDGRALYFNDRGIRKLDLSNGEQSPVLESRPVHQKFLSPDGRYLYFSGARTDTNIWRFEFTTAKLAKLVDTLLPGYWGAWAMVREGIYFLTGDSRFPGGAAISLRSFADGRTRRITHFPGPLPSIGATMWSLTPDGHYLYCVRVDLSASDLVLVDGFL